MWKRIHSNRDPRDTLFREIRKEFSGWFDHAGTYWNALIGRYPRLTFGVMIFLLVVSAVLSFTVLHRPDRKEQVIRPAAAVRPVGEGFGKIMAVTDRIRETLRLKGVVDSLSAKKQLTTADSMTLERTLDELQHLQNH